MAEESKALVPVEQKVVEFYGDELTAVLVDVGDKPQSIRKKLLVQNVTFTQRFFQ